LPDNRPVSENPEYFITAKDYENFAPVMQAGKRNFSPGEKYEYSNPAFNGLALIIDKGRVKKNDSGVRFVYYTGDQGGFRAFYFSIPEKDLLYIGLFNRPPEDLDGIIRTGLTLLRQNKWLD
jgi:hypothetical protein